MADWTVSSYRDPSNPAKETWVYYENVDFPGIHMSRCVTDNNKDHMATNDGTAYYYGVSKTFNSPTIPAATQTNLTDAWKDYFKV